MCTVLLYILSSVCSSSAGPLCPVHVLLFSRCSGTLCMHVCVTVHASVSMCMHVYMCGHVWTCVDMCGHVWTSVYMCGDTCQSSSCDLPQVFHSTPVLLLQADTVHATSAACHILAYIPQYAWWCQASLGL